VYPYVGLICIIVVTQLDEAEPPSLRLGVDLLTGKTYHSHITYRDSFFFFYSVPGGRFVLKTSPNFDINSLMGTKDKDIHPKTDVGGQRKCRMDPNTHELWVCVDDNLGLGSVLCVCVQLKARFMCSLYSIKCAFLH